MPEKNEIKKLETLKFPDCIARFEDEHCQNATAEKPSKDCELCPFFKHYKIPEKKQTVAELELELAAAKQILKRKIGLLFFILPGIILLICASMADNSRKFKIVNLRIQLETLKELKRGNKK